MSPFFKIVKKSKIYCYPRWTVLFPGDHWWPPYCDTSLQVHQNKHVRIHQLFISSEILFNHVLPINWHLCWYVKSLRIGIFPKCDLNRGTYLFALLVCWIWVCWHTIKVEIGRMWSSRVHSCTLLCTLILGCTKFILKLKLDILDNFENLHEAFWNFWWRVKKCLKTKNNWRYAVQALFNKEWKNKDD